MAAAAVLIAGIGFTVSLLIASLAFHGTQLEEAKIGVLTAALVASTATWLLFRTTSMLPTRLRIRALLGTAEVLVDLAAPVDPERDHIRGPEEAPVTRTRLPGRMARSSAPNGASVSYMT